MQHVRDATVVVTGGTGFIGQALCAKLIEQGARVYVVTRSKERAIGPITYVSSIAELRATAVDVIINLAGEPIAQRWTPATKRALFASRVDTTASIIDFIKTASQPPALLISASAIGYYGSDAAKIFDESTTPAEGAPFARSLCSAWEAEAFKAQSYGVRTVLLRLGAVLAKNGGMLAKLLPAFRLGLGGPIGDGRQWLSWIDRDDVLQLILHIIDSPAIAGPVNATTPHPVTNNDFAKTLATVLHRPCVLRLPTTVLRTIYGDMADELMLQGQQVLPTKALATGFDFSYGTVAASLDHIFASKKHPL